MPLTKLLLLLLLLLLGACGPQEQAAYAPSYTAVPPPSPRPILLFGIHPLHNPQRLQALFGPIANYLGTQLGDVSIRVEASRNYEAFNEKLYAGKFHLALPNPYQTVNALRHGYYVFGKMADDDSFRGIILVRRDSGIRQVGDLRGKAVSFPAPTALAATMMPQYYLQTHGLNVMQDIDIRYVGSQESAIMNVMLGNTAAGATWPPPWRAMKRERPELDRELELIWQTDPLPSNSLMARKDLDPELVRRIGRLLFSLQDHDEGVAWLERMEQSRFEPANDDTYQPVRVFLEKFSRQVRPLQ